MKTPPLRFGLVALGLILFAGCAAAPESSTSKAVAPPKLVVFMVADGLPMRQLTGYRDQLAPDGFRRFFDRGSWFANAYFGQAHTVTAPGHAVLLTGAYPHRTGIISNAWRDPLTGNPVYCTGDEAYRYLDHKTAPMAGTSPRNLRAESVGDVLRGVQPLSKVIGISGKDRGAILPAGKLGTAYMYMSASGGFASSTYYMSTHPQWVKTFNESKPADAYFKQTWKPLLADSAYARSVPDGQSWMAKGGSDDHLPASDGDPHDAPGPLFYAKLLSTPFGDALTLAFARAAIEGEKLGQDDAPDILSISLSSHDYVNHAYGPESRLSQDHLLQLDRQLQDFFSYLDAKVGAGNYVAMLSADHGFMDTPEWSQHQGKDGGRLNPRQASGWLNAGLSKAFGAGKWALGWSGAGILLDSELIAAKQLAPAEVDQQAKALLLKLGGVADVFTREQLLGNDTSTPYLDAMRKSWHADIGASLQVLLKPNWMVSSRTAGTTHGSPYEYDTHVPILVYGPHWVGHGQVDTRVEVTDIAPTLAGLLGVRVPAQSEGKPLPLPAE